MTSSLNTPPLVFPEGKKHTSLSLQTRRPTLGREKEAAFLAIQIQMERSSGGERAPDICALAAEM